MSKRKTAAWIALAAGTMIAVMLLIPGLLVKPIQHEQQAADHQPVPEVDTSGSPIVIPVYVSGDKKIEKFPLETYVRGVVAAEMPANFQMEALKAQAIAARTYIVRKWIDHDTSTAPVKGALVTDQAADQAFLTLEEMKKQWPPSEFEMNLRRINQAVNETKDVILTFDDKPIVAAFFSTSNGYTENSEDYWSSYIPYLRSVASPWDEELSPKYKTDASYPVADVLKKLGLSASAPDGIQLKVEQWTEGHRIKSIRINQKLFSGREVREKLGLNSSEFSWKIESGKIDFTTVGFGHGVGMSQWGADVLAGKGKTAEEILTYYYTGVKIDRLENIVKSI